MLHLKSRSILAACAVVVLSACNPAATTEPGAVDQPATWVSSWISAQQVPEPGNALPDTALDDATLRQVVRVTLGGQRVRLRVSNVFGDRPLTIGGVTIARSLHGDSSEIAPNTTVTATFSSARAVTIPAGAYIVSDPLDFGVRALDQLAVSMYFPAAPDRQSGHPGSRATSYLLAGRHLSDASVPGATEVDHWYQLSAIEVEAESGSKALVVLGDSITDGFGVKANSNQRWTDYLASRVQQDARLRCRLAVLNAGLGGNRILLDGLGPNALARFDRDVLSRPGTRHVLVLLGVNDLGMLSRLQPADPSDRDEQVRQIIGALQQMVQRARHNRVRIIGGTILPFVGSTYYQPDEKTDAARNRINDWIREPGNFDALVDFDARMSSPGDRSRLASRFDSGDHLHPSIAGYEAMAELVSLDLFRDRTSTSTPCRATGAAATQEAP